MKVKNTGYRLKFFALAVVCIFVFLLSFFLGRYSVGFFTAVKILFNRLLKFLSFGYLGIKNSWTSAQESVVINIRLPRIACAAIIGASLSVAGVSYQGMFRNPMVSPDLLGASTGAGFGAALGILLGFTYFGITISAFIFGLVAVIIALTISKASRISATLALVLSGVIVSSLFSSGTSFIKLIADTESQLPAITYWLMGSLTSVKNKDLVFVLIPVLIGIIPLFALRWRINLLTLSDNEAQSMGVETEKLRVIVIGCSTLITAASVSVSGMIGWVGLVIPHFCRLIFGQDYRRLLPSSALLGATFLMVVDNISRTLTSAEIPIGILTSFVGAPVFLYLIITGGTESDS
ncbi:MAG: iron ABC transporter permease [Sphaerochaetaceae bacterium]|nr:iron ABC transporter permease [Sphaerochaetaceae bacterium]